MKFRKCDNEDRYEVVADTTNAWTGYGLVLTGKSSGCAPLWIFTACNAWHKSTLNAPDLLEISRKLDQLNEELKQNGY